MRRSPTQGDISLYAVGYDAASGYALLTPEEAGGDLTYERMEDVALGGSAGKALALHGRGQPLGLPRRGGGRLLLQHHGSRA